MDGMSSVRHPITFNGPLEAGVRAVAVLYAAFPKSFDLQKLVAFDFLLVRTAQLGGPDDLHPKGPIHMPATEVRREVVGSALLLMMTRDLVVREAHADGIEYKAGETAALFMESFESPYLLALQKRAEWLVDFFSCRKDSEFDIVMRRFFDDWVVEFQSAESSLGTDL